MTCCQLLEFDFPTRVLKTPRWSDVTELLLTVWSGKFPHSSADERTSPANTAFTFLKYAYQTLNSNMTSVGTGFINQKYMNNTKNVIDGSKNNHKQQYQYLWWVWQICPVQCYCGYNINVNIYIACAHQITTSRWKPKGQLLEHTWTAPVPARCTWPLTFDHLVTGKTITLRGGMQLEAEDLFVLIDPSPTTEATRRIERKQNAYELPWGAKMSSSIKSESLTLSDTHLSRVFTWFSFIEEGTQY